VIRNATLADLAGIKACAQRLHAKSVYADVPSDVETFARTVCQCVQNAFGFAMVSVHDDQITGFMLGAAVPLWFSRKRSATDIVTYAEHPGDGYKMIKAFIDWAWSTPAVVEVTMAQSSGLDVERTGIIYERAGLIRVGSLYTAVRETAVAEEAA
jgi:hypothetical protein